jgi:hypothetical protein
MDIAIISLISIMIYSLQPFFDASVDIGSTLVVFVVVDPFSMDFEILDLLAADIDIRI